MASSSSSSVLSVKREEFNAFHKIDRSLFSRLVLSLSRDISKSLQVMSFLLYLEKSGLAHNLILNLVSLPDLFINTVADEVVACLSLLAYVDCSTYFSNQKSFTIPTITRMTGGYLTLSVIHQDRENILKEMKKHLIRTCYPAFEDILVQAEMHNKKKMSIDQEMEKTMENMKQLAISKVGHKAESSNQILSGQQEITGTSKVGAVSEDAQVMAEDRIVFLTFSKGYPVSAVELYAYFTRRFGDIIEAILMPGVGHEQVLYATMVLRSAAMVPEILSSEEIKNKFTIKGKHVWARKFIPKYSNNISPSY
ncbi:hypothetical protein V5N11_013267 [Cardamine amara subsp. amara]|uniref:Uncharacterized protein n=1 Tax=Cardamine amara subsp. amara TaxID=228776 RepID=A0ABD0ZE76_CARAN